MKIRTRLLLFLLPTTIGATVFISAILSYNWHAEIVSNFKTKLLSSTLTYNSLVQKKDPQPKENSPQLQKALSDLQSKLNINSFYTISKLPKQAQLEKKPYLHYCSTAFQKNSKSKIMTVYLPIANSKAFLAADASLDIVYEKFQEELFIIIVTSVFALIAMAGSLVLMAKKIVRPIQKLNNSALTIAAGQYGDSVKINGPKELKELSNTLNTMSECLYENINRLKENTLIREKTHGEYECAMFLQNYMLQKVIDECPADNIATKAISFYSYEPRGFLLDFPSLTDELLQIQLAEAKEGGFDDMYLLLTNYKLFKNSNKKMLNKNYPFQQISIIKPSNLLVYKTHQLLPPFIWSLSEKKLFSQNNYFLKAGDFVFLSNKGLANYFSAPIIKTIIERVFSVFAEEGLEVASNMLKKEISFAVKRKDTEEDLHLLCLQILY